MPNLESLALWVLGTLVSAFVGSYLGAYLKRKAENLATHEDLDKLIEQVQAVTRETEAIKCEITSGLWDRQKRWEARRDILFEFVRSTARIDPALREIVSCWSTKPDGAEPPHWWSQFITDATNKWLGISSEWEGAKGLSDVVSGGELKAVSAAWFALRTEILAKARSGDTNSFTASLEELNQSSSRLYAAVRKELCLDELSESTSEQATIEKLPLSGS